MTVMNIAKSKPANGPEAHEAVEPGPPEKARRRQGTAACKAAVLAATGGCELIFADPDMAFGERCTATCELGRRQSNMPTLMSSPLSLPVANRWSSSTMPTAQPVSRSRQGAGWERSPRRWLKCSLWPPCAPRAGPPDSSWWHLPQGT